MAGLEAGLASDEGVRDGGGAVTGEGTAEEEVEAALVTTTAGVAWPGGAKDSG